MRDVESFDDFIQYYQQRYFLSKKDPAVMYCLMGAADRGTASLRVYKEGKSVGDVIWRSKSLNEFDVQWGLPVVGMTSVDNELVYLYYRTARNGSRGFGGDRVVAHSFNGWQLAQHGVVVAGIMYNPHEVWKALKPDHLTLALAWDQVTAKSPKIAASLSYRFGIYQASNKENPTLCYKTIELGDVLGPNSVRLEPQHYEYQELMRRVINPKLEIHCELNR